jgi:hypothetical protein
MTSQHSAQQQLPIIKRIQELIDATKHIHHVYDYWVATRSGN